MADEEVPVGQVPGDDISADNPDDFSDPPESETEETETETEEVSEGEVEKEEESEEEEEVKKELDERDQKDEKDPEDKKLLSQIRRPSLNKMLAKYPTIDKEFPELKHVYFREQEFSKICGTVEDAKDMAKVNDNYQMLDGALARGEVDKFVKFLSDDAKDLFAQNILRGLRQVDKSLFVKATKPFLVGILRDVATKYKGDVNTLNSVKNLSNKLFGTPNLEELEEEKADPRLEEERRQLENQKREHYESRYGEFRSSVDNYVVDKLNIELTAKLPSDIPEGQKKAIVRSIITDLDELLGKDGAHISAMNSLWKRAERENLNKEWRSKIITTHLGRARQEFDNLIKQYTGKGSTKKVAAPVKRTSSDVTPEKKQVSGKKDLRNTREVSELDVFS